MVNSGRGAEIVNDARNNNRKDENRSGQEHEPTLDRDFYGNYKTFQECEHQNQQESGNHVCNQFRHAYKIVFFSRGCAGESIKKQNIWLSRETEIYYLSYLGKPSPIRD